MALLAIPEAEIIVDTDRVRLINVHYDERRSSGDRIDIHVELDNGTIREFSVSPKHNESISVRFEAIVNQLNGESPS